MWLADESWAESVTVRSPRRVGPGQRRRIRRRLEALDAHPSIPPAALLFVRRLSVETLPGVKSSAAWDQDIRARLMRLYETAARPAEGAADPSVEAVVFPDEAVMVACLLADIRRGWAQGLWWWRTVWSRGTLPRSTGAILEHRPREVPAVFRELERMSEAVPVAAPLEREQAAAVVRTMLATHGASELAEVFEVALSSVDSNGRSAVATVSAALVGDRRKTDFEPARMPAGLPRLPPGADRLPPENRVLVTLALELAAAPHVVRSAEFAARAREWLRAEFSAPLGVPSRTRQSPKPGAELPPAIADWASYSSEEQLASEVEQTETRPPRLRQPELPMAARDQFSMSPVELSAALAREAAFQRPAPLKSDFTPPAVPAEAFPARPTLPETGVRTRLGGALYLIAAFERLGIPECFEPAWPLSAHFSHWGVLELVARGLLDAAGLTETYRDDPLWATLALLDGRDPGLSLFQDFPVRKQFRLPAAWAAELHAPGEKFEWATRNRRIATWSREGWILVDRPLTEGESCANSVRGELASAGLNAGSGNEQLHWNTAPHAHLGNGLPIAAALKFWLECALPALRVWLARAIALDQPDYAALVETLLLVTGNLFVTSTRVDFVAPIDQTRIPVRRAALDLDPGWLPAWGRSVQFHYGDAQGGLR